MQGLSDHKRAFLKANPLLLNQEIMPIAGRAWQQALAQGIRDDTPEINDHILKHVRQGIEAHRATPAMAPEPRPMPPPMPAYNREEVERAAERLANLPPIATPRRSMPVSAPVSRDVPTAGGQKMSAQQTVTLNAEERSIAHGAYHWMRKADAEAEYAKQKLKLSSLRKAGVYPEPERN